MRNERRDFIQTASLLTAGSVLLPHWACSNINKNENSANKPVIKMGSLENFGIQLYTLRDVVFDDPKATMKQVAEMGYTQIEGYENDLGLFWGMTNLELKEYLDGIGLKMVASHCNIYEDMELKATQAAEIGMEYLICAWVGPQKSMDDWKKITDQFNATGEICRKNGIKFAYHNHAYSFKPFTGMIPHNYMMENTSPDLVDFEMDIYWVVTGGGDPIEYLTKYPNRFRLCHIKDRIKNADIEENNASCNLGEGMIDFPKILKVAADNGMKYFLMEQERYDNSTPIKSAQVGAEYLKKLEFA